MIDPMDIAPDCNLECRIFLSPITRFVIRNFRVVCRYFCTCTMAWTLYCFLFLTVVSNYGDVSASIQLRNVIHDQQRLWGGRTMIYAIGSNYDSSSRALIEKSMREIEQAVNAGDKACFSFKQKTRSGDHFLYFGYSDNSVCHAEVNGKSHEHRQFLYLTDKCLNARTIKSLLVVTMGLYHEHQRPDRDQYIQVHMDNVQDDVRRDFSKISSGDTDLLGLPYDFHSITHYGPYQYAVNQSIPTITTNVSGVTFGDRDTLSFYDVIKIQELYRCDQGYTMFGHDVNRLKQQSPLSFYPQWRFKPDKLPNYMNTTCDTTGLDNYTFTVLNGATLSSEFPLPPGNFCVSVSICIASSSPEIKSSIKLITTEGLDVVNLNYTQPSGQWKRFNSTFTSDQEWTMLVKAHIMWGGDVLALNNMVMTNGPCEM